MDNDIGSSNVDGQCYSTGEVPMSEEDLLNTIDFELDGEHGRTQYSTVDFTVGMEFDSQEEIYKLYNAFALKRGFGIRRRNSKENYLLLTCSRNGTSNVGKGENDIDQRLTSLTRCGCKAAISASKAKESDQWKLTRFVDIHNHEMVTPKSVTLLKSHKSYSIAARSLTESFSKAGIPIARVPTIFGTSNLPFDARDCYNHLQKVRNILYEAGDAQAVQVYCIEEREKDPHFYYDIQFDDESRMRNFFWVDSRSRKAYELFGDVITFDTTYRTNKYSMPFAPFVGINHHLQSVMFGCALLHDETVETFTWLFQTWLKAMKGKSPKGIITDQDAAMAKAIRNVFPTARHRLCLWHITTKFAEKLPLWNNSGSEFRDVFKNVLYNSKTVEVFETEWHRVLNAYQLVDNEWLKGLYDIRDSWIPVFNRTFFWAGMSTTQRSESINAFFNRFVHSRMMLREFVGMYDTAVNSRYECYRREEFDSVHKVRKLTLNLCIEEHAALVYTRNVFVKFHEELSEGITLLKEKTSKQGSVSLYRVWDRKAHWNDHTVEIDFSDLRVSCTCREFEFVGILCRHILNILVSKSVTEIPPQYILQRWRKDGNKISTNSQATQAFDARSFRLQQKYSKLNEFADKSEAAYRFIEEAIDSIISTVDGIVSNEEANTDSLRTDIGSTPAEQTTEVTLNDPHISQTKGRKRIKSGIELSQKNKNVCGNCGHRGHNRRSCRKSQ